MDVYRAHGGGGASAVLVHGGGFLVGSRAMKPVRLLASRLSDAGVTVASVDYRMIFRGGRLDESVSDLRDALDAWIQGAPGRDLDPARVSVVGLSAGATLALLAADPRLHRVACAFGLYDFSDLRGPLASLLPRLLLRSSDRSHWSARSPLLASACATPTLLLHGTADALVPVAQAHALEARRRAQGLPTRLEIYQDAPHAFFNHEGPASAAALRALIEHLGA